MNARGGQAGFTLIEIMAAVAVLGIAMFVLLDAHYTAMRLYDSVQVESTARQLLESIVQEAEVLVIQGEYSGGGDFGNRYPEFTWTFESERLGQEEIQLYQVNVTLNGPDEPRSLSFYTYAVSPPDEEGLFNDSSGGGATGNRSGNSGNTGVSGNNSGAGQQSGISGAGSSGTFGRSGSRR